MSGAAWALQKAIVAALEGNAALKAAMGIASGDAPILDHVPENQPMPYVELEDNDGRAWDAGASAGGMEYGDELTIRLYSWSSYEGTKQAKAMNDAIKRALRDQSFDLTADGHRLINLRVQFSYVLKDADLQANYGVLQLRAVTEEAA